MDKITFSSSQPFMDFMIPFLEKHPQTKRVQRTSATSGVLEYKGDLHQITSDIQKYADEHWEEVKRNG